MQLKRDLQHVSRDTRFFTAFKSMQNAQVLEHTNGLAKYVCKYIPKVDEGKYVVLCVDVDTGQWVLAKTHLHNTKIVSSKITKMQDSDNRNLSTTQRDVTMDVLN